MDYNKFYWLMKLCLAGGGGLGGGRGGVEFAPQRNMLFALLADLNHQHKPYRFF